MRWKMPTLAREAIENIGIRNGITSSGIYGL